MGCSSSNSDTTTPLPKILHIEPKAVNEYIDQLPLLVLQKLKQKFDMHCDHNFELPQDQFALIYAGSARGDEPVSNSTQAQKVQQLYSYYSDLGQSRLNLKKFITKYATLWKSEPGRLGNIIYFILSTAKDEEGQQSQTGISLSKDQYNAFIKSQRKYFGFQPTLEIKSEVSSEQFNKHLIEAGFLWEQYRKNFLLIDKEDIPFQAISRGLVDMDISDLVVGQEYYIISTQWFQRWSYYFQGVANEHENSYISTKLVKQRSSLASGKKRKSINRTSIANRNDLSINDSSKVIERPTLISFEDVEGEFIGELKDNIKAHLQLKIVSKELWQLFKKTMPAETEYKRTANSISTLDLYPKSIYYFNTDKSGKIIDESFKIIQFSQKRKLRELTDAEDRSIKKYYFIKNFGDSSWSQEKQDTALGMCSIYSRFFVVGTFNKNEFLDRYLRNKKSTENLTYGDKVYSFFSFNKKVMPAYVIRMPTEKTALIHYLDFNFRYENEVKIESLSVEEEALVESNKKDMISKKPSEDQFSFKGLNNIGNTCFINSIIQCLIATPILDQYFLNIKPNEKQSLLYEIVEVASCLLQNRKVSPVNLKKKIGMKMELFGGNDQHDAQEFLSYLLQQLIAEIKLVDSEDENVFQHLFEGKVQSTLECCKCQNVRKIEEIVRIISLPIPQPQYNTFVLFVFPIYDHKIKKVTIRLHRESKVSDYLTSFEERLGCKARDYIFTEYYSRTMRIRNDLFENANKKIILTNFIPSGTEVHCFERFKNQQVLKILEENKKLFNDDASDYFDFYDKQNDRWLYGRFLDRQKKNKIEIMNQDNCFSTLKEKGANWTTKPLGDMTKELVCKKITTRKLNQVLRKMEPFGYYGIQYMIEFPKFVTYRQLSYLVNLVLMNFLDSSMSGSKKRPYILKILDIGREKQKCIFCSSAEAKIISKQELKECCKLTDEQLNTPLIWVARERQYCIIVDWITTENFNSHFGQVEQDQLSSIAQKMKSNDKIEVEDCLKLYQQPENVDMECEKCKHRAHNRTQTMKEVPNILVLHMKEFRVTHDMTLLKMDVNLKWLEYLDITRYSLKQKGTIYELYAYVRHHGTSQSGHYTCAIKRKHPFEKSKKVWVNFDDDMTLLMDNEQNNIDSAYLLFFKRVDMPTSGFVNFTNMQYVGVWNNDSNQNIKGSNSKQKEL